jgi:HSP20 family protein
MEENKVQNKPLTDRAPLSRNSNLASASNALFTPLRMFDELFRGLLPGIEGSEPFLLVPRVDVEDRDDEYCVTFDIPGVPRENIKIDIIDNQLTVTAERQIENQGSRRGSRQYGAFQRTLMLPTSVDSESIRAEYGDGVLSLHIPRSEKSRPRRIEVAAKSASIDTESDNKTRDKAREIH